MTMVVLLPAACGGSSEASETPQPTTVADDTSETVSQRSSLLPDIQGIANWINSEPTTIEAEIADGNVVLIDFWTYTYVNCLRTMPHLKGWHEKYGDRGLTILGVHSPEFDFEKDNDNVQKAVESIGVLWPMA